MEEKQAVTPIEKKADVALERLVPLAERYLENQLKSVEKEWEVEKMISEHEHTFQIETQKIELSKFRYIYWLFAAILLFFMAVSVGLIFFLKDVGSGKAILANLAFYGTGLLSGLGLNRLIKGKEKDKNPE